MDGLLVGRFQPFHLGHLHALGFALGRVENLWLGLGSSNRPAGADNPFSAGQRREMILASLDYSMRGRVRTYPIPDVDDHARWVGMIDGIVPPFGAVFSNDPMTARMYAGRPVEVVPIPFLDRGALSGTNVRALMASGGEWGRLVPAGAREFLLRHGAGGRAGDL